MIDARHFPESMRLIVEAIGVDSAMLLAKTYGGCKVCVPLPEKLVDVHPVAKLLGMDKAMALSTIAGGTRMLVPLYQSVNERRQLADRDEEIVKRWRQGDNANIIARKFGIHERHVMRIIARQRGRAIGQ